MACSLPDRGSHECILHLIPPLLFCRQVLVGGDPWVVRAGADSDLKCPLHDDLHWKIQYSSWHSSDPRFTNNRRNKNYQGLFLLTLFLKQNQTRATKIIFLLRPDWPIRLNLAIITKNWRSRTCWTPLRSSDLCCWDIDHHQWHTCFFGCYFICLEL